MAILMPYAGRPCLWGVQTLAVLTVDSMSRLQRAARRDAVAVTNTEACKYNKEKLVEP